MNRTLVVFFALSSAVFAQSRVDDFDAASLVVTEVVLVPRPDGGCAARGCGVVESADGGARLAACMGELVELKAAANQNRCAALADAMGKRVANRLRFTVDAGAP